MKRLLVSLFSEESEISIMRVMAIASLIIGAALAFKGADASIVSLFVISAFGGKVAQKFAEKDEKRKDAFPDVD